MLLTVERAELEVRMDAHLCLLHPMHLRTRRLPSLGCCFLRGTSSISLWPGSPHCSIPAPAITASPSHPAPSASAAVNDVFLVSFSASCPPLSCGSLTAKLEIRAQDRSWEEDRPEAAWPPKL
jgi:hypothetical protein